MTKVKVTDLDPTGGIAGQAPVIDSVTGLPKWSTVSSSGGSGGAAFSGALVKKSVTATGINVTAGYSIPWDSETYDIGGWHDTSVNTERLTVPAGVTRVRVGMGLLLSNVTAETDVYINLRKNGAAFVGYIGDSGDQDFTDVRKHFWSPVVSVSPGDYFEARVSAADTSIDITTDCWFAIEAVESQKTSSAARGCLAWRSAALTGQNYTAETAIPFDAEVYDTDNIHDNITNPSRLTVPSGVTKVTLSATVVLGNVAATAEAFLLMKKNGAFFVGGAQQIAYADASSTFPRSNLVSAMVDCVAGDYFELFIRVAGDTSVDVIASETYFAMQVVEAVAVSPPVSGTVFPTSPSDGQLFYRTDYKVQCVYISAAAAWYTDEIFTAQAAGMDTVLSVSTTVGRFLNPLNGRFGSSDAYLMRVRFLCFMSGTGNWTLNLNVSDASTIATSGALTATNAVNVDVNANTAFLSHGDVRAVENSGTATVLVTAALSYRQKVV